MWIKWYTPISKLFPCYSKLAFKLFIELYPVTPNWDRIFINYQINQYGQLVLLPA